MITRIFIESLGWVREPNKDDVFTNAHHKGLLLWQNNDGNWLIKARGTNPDYIPCIFKPTNEGMFREWVTVQVSKLIGANKWPWWMKAIADWQAVRARGESLRSEHDKQSKIEAEARRVAAGIDGDYTYLLELCGNWPKQELTFLDAVEMTGNYDVLPWDHWNRPSCTCHVSPPCSVCSNGDYWIDWRVGK